MGAMASTISGCRAAHAYVWQAPIDQLVTSRIRSTPSSSVSRRCCATTLSYVVTRGKRPFSNGAGVLLGEDETPAPKWFGTTMKYRLGSSARSGPVIHCAVSDGVAVNHVGQTTTLSLAAFSVPRVV